VNQVGIILGPSLLGRLKIFKNVLFPNKSQEIIGILSLFSYTLFLFVSGVKMDVGMIKRNGRKALFTGVASMLFPLLIGLSVELKIGMRWLKEEEYKLPYLTVAHCIASFPVLALLLDDLKILNSELGRLSLSTTLVCDMLSLLAVLSSSLVGTYQEQGSILAARNLVAVIIYIFVLVYAIRPAMFWVIRQTPKGRPIKDAYIHIIMLMILGISLLSNHFGQTLLYGPFLLGLAIPDGPPLGSTIVNKFNCFISDVFLPLYVTTYAMRTDLRLLKFDNNFMTINGILIVLTFVAKMLASSVPPLYAKMPLNDALSLALLMCFKGVTQLDYYSFLNDIQVTISFLHIFPLENEITFFLLL
jgi:Kef-type K+ transport system membrane component KefB